MVDEVMTAVCGGGASTFRYRDFTEFAVAYAFPSASGRLERASLPAPGTTRRKPLMSDLTLAAERRDTTGSGPSGRLRNEGRIPAVLYGKGIDTPISITVDHREVRHAFQDKANRLLTFTLTVDGTPHQVKIQEIQRDPVRNTAAHIDFITV